MRGLNLSIWLESVQENKKVFIKSTCLAHKHTRRKEKEKRKKKKEKRKEETIILRVKCSAQCGRQPLVLGRDSRVLWYYFEEGSCWGYPVWITLKNAGKKPLLLTTIWWVAPPPLVCITWSILWLFQKTKKEKKRKKKERKAYNSHSSSCPLKSLSFLF